MFKTSRFKSKMAILTLVFLWGRVAILVPAPVPAAQVTSTAEALLGVPIFTDAAGAPVVVNWIDSTGADMRGSLSGVGTILNGDPEIYNADYADGVPWQNTFVTFTQGTVPNTVKGTADTHSSQVAAIDPNTSQLIVPPFAAANRLFASSNLALSTPLTTGSIFAQALLGGQFTVPTATNLTVSLSYSLLISLFSLGGNSNYAEAIAGLYLYDFNTEAVLAFDENILSQLINGDGSFSNSLLNQTLTLTWLLDPAVTYDFEAFATVNADAAVAAPPAVPEPISMVLLGTGMLGLAILRKRFA
jgi:hypothetical protein